MTEAPKLKLIMAETVAGDTTEETIELLLTNLRDQLLARLKRGGYVVDPETVRGIVRGQYGGSSRIVEVWAMYEQHTTEHREALTDAYGDGLASARRFRATVYDNAEVTDEHGEPLTGKAWGEYVKALAECPYESEPDHGLSDAEVEVFVVAWRRGWAEVGEAEAEGRAIRSAPYKRIVRP